VDWLSATAIVSVVGLWRSGQVDHEPLLVALAVIIVVARVWIWRLRKQRLKAAAAP